MIQKLPYDELRFEMNKNDHEQYIKELINLIDNFNNTLDEKADIFKDKIKEHLKKNR
jgi:hypothetical protein